MSDYTFIKGQRLQSLSTDPENASEGQIWYNSTDEKLRGKISSPLGVWSTGGNMITGRDSHVGAGTQSAGLSIGAGPPATGNSHNSEEYDGSSWTSGNLMNNKRVRGGGDGVQTAAYYAGGSPGYVNLTEEYDGTSFTTSGNLGTGRDRLEGVGTQTAGLVFGGYSPTLSPRYAVLTEEYNGSSWTAGGDYPFQAIDVTGAGTQTAGLAFGGRPSPSTTQNQISTYEYDGSSWTAGGYLMNNRYHAAGAGTQTAALAICGSIANVPYFPARNVFVEEYDGTTWKTAGNRNITIGTGGAGAGTTTAGLAFGGVNPSSSPTITNVTEEYNVDGDNLHVSDLGI